MPLNEIAIFSKGKNVTSFSGSSRIVWIALASATLISPIVGAEVSIYRAGSTVAMENDLLRFVYDLSTGKYDATDRRDSSLCIKDGWFQIGDCPSTLPGLAHTWSSRAVSDELGRGKALVIHAKKSDQPDLILEVTLYEERGVIVFAGGVENTTDHPSRLKQIRPMAGAKLFPGLDMNQNFRLLDGHGGGEPLEWGVKKYTAVHRGNSASSRNNLLMTFGAHDTRRSLLMGGLTYHDFEKFAKISQARRLELTAGQDGKASLVCYLDLPDDNVDQSARGESLRLSQGSAKRRFSYQALWGEELASAAADPEAIVLEASGLNSESAYYLGFSWWHTDAQDHVQSVTVDSGPGTPEHVLLDRAVLPMWHNKKKLDPEQLELLIPRAAYASGNLRVRFASHTEDVQAVVSEAWLRQGGGSTLLPATLTAVNETPRPRHAFTGQLHAEDPVGRRVDPGIRYMPDDRFYVDFMTCNPFENLEQYGRSIRRAQKIELNMYDFPTVCLWYAHHGAYGGGAAQNDTVGAVAEMDKIAATGFLNYARAAVRLVPDCYSKNNQQGWWDDAHFQQHGSTNLGEFQGGTYKQPYETSEKWGRAVIARGGIPLTYCQTGFRSEDYAHAFPEHMLFNQSVAWMRESYKRPLDDDEFWGNAWRKSFRVWSYDYTDPDFIAHLKEVYAQYRSGGIKGLMFDYPARGWAAGGGMEDDYDTTAQAYRNIFRLARQGLGPEVYVHERNMERGSDITLGLVSSQRTENDTDRISPGVVTRCGLRWYKNRVVVNYDTDSKNIARLQKNRDVLRSLLTMSYVTTGRLLLANSFAQLSAQTLHDLSRVFPFHTQTQSARPVDAFKRKYPRIYDFAVSPSWHQLTLFNDNNEDEVKIDVQLAGSTAEGALGLHADKQYYAYDFWNDALVGKLRGSSEFSQRLRPGEVRMLSLHEKQDHPQFISTNRHVMQGYIDLIHIEWLPGRNLLRGISRVVGEDPYVVSIMSNGFVAKNAEVSDTRTKADLDPGHNGLVKLRLLRPANAIVEWAVRFE
jgi:hypothetical protein